jgi:MFS family permease
MPNHNTEKVCIVFPLFYLQVFAESHGISPQLSFYLLAIANGASAFGRILPNFVADKLGVFNMLIASSAVSGVIIFCWLPATNTAGVIVIALLFGFSSGAYVSLIPGVFQSLSSHMGEMGVRLGLAWAVVALAALTGTPIEGYAYLLPSCCPVSNNAGLVLSSVTRSLHGGGRRCGLASRLCQGQRYCSLHEACMPRHWASQGFERDTFLLLMIQGSLIDYVTNIPTVMLRFVIGSDMLSIQYHILVMLGHSEFSPISW